MGSRERHNCVKVLSEKILHVVINRKKFTAEGLDYIRGNEELAVDVCTMLDQSRDILEMDYLRFKFGNLMDNVTPECLGDSVGGDGGEEDDVAEVSEGGVDEPTVVSKKS